MTPQNPATPVNPAARVRGRGVALSVAPWAGSTLAHAAVIGGVALVLARQGPSLQAPSVAISFGDPRPAERPPPSAPRAPAQQEVAPIQPVRLPTAELAAPPLAASPLTDPPVSVTLSAPALPAEEPLADARAIPTDAAAPELFGARGERSATRVVYVIDASGSMVAAYPTVVREIERSLSRLGPECDVQALVFKDGGFATAPGLSRDALVKATDANKRGLIRWLGSIRADRRGDPLPAMERAITFRPDVVFLVSKGLGDGALTPAEGASRRDAILARLDALNPSSGTAGRRPVSIKVIQFFDPDSAGLMHAIGRSHGGEDGYVFLSRKDLGLE